MPATEDVTFKSAAVGKEMRYRVLRPALGMRPREPRYPVLYLLHGFTGDFMDWESRTHLAEYVAGLGLIVVMPDGQDSWYTNAAADPALKFEDYIVKDLVADVEQRFPVIRSRHARAIAGLSMGGYGAIKIGLKFPGTYAMAAGLSGAYFRDVDKWNERKPLYDSLLKAFGPAGHPARAENDVFALAAAADPARVPYFYLDCGTEDGLIENNRELSKVFLDRKVAYEYHEGPGAHTWPYWDGNIRRVLDVVREKLAVRRGF
jgi:S-formylglutathione hydrolase FrmB